MNKKKWLLLALSFAFTWGHCQENANQESQITGSEMSYSIEEQQEKFFIGLELRTNNEECSSTMPTHKEKFLMKIFLQRFQTG